MTPEEAKVVSDRVCDAAEPFLFVSEPRLGELVEAALQCASALLDVVEGETS